MSLKWKIIGGLLAVLLLAGLIVYWVMPERFITRVDKSLLEYFGGNCTVEVYSAGTKIREYKVDGYVLFERAEGGLTAPSNPGGRHDGVITFKDKDGRKVRVGAWGGTTLVECK
jgi:hypothetical protein